MNNKKNQQYDDESDFEVQREGSGVVITKYLGTKQEVRIPPRIQNFLVTSIGDRAFADCYSITSVIIPNSIANIGEDAFANCASLTAINVVADNSAYTSESGVLYNKNKTVLLKYPEGKTGVSFTIPNSVTSIWDNAFCDCASLTNITIPDSVTSIGVDAFSNCTSLTEITITNSITGIEFAAFQGCTSLTAINVAANNSAYTSDNGVLYNKNKTVLHTYPAGKTGTSFNIPDSVTSIWDNAFCDCASLTNITIPDSVTSIGGGAFWNCNSLTSVTIPDSVTYIGDYAFFECEGLTSITIPNSVKSIGERAFLVCTNLTSVMFQGAIASDEFHDDAFNGDLRDKFYASDPANGTPGTYTRASGGSVWTRR